MTGKDHLPEDIRAKIKEMQAEADEAEDLDEIDLDQITGGTSLNLNYDPERASTYQRLRGMDLGVPGKGDPQT